MGVLFFDRPLRRSDRRGGTPFGGCVADVIGVDWLFGKMPLLAETLSLPKFTFLCDAPAAGSPLDHVGE